MIERKTLFSGATLIFLASCATNEVGKREGGRFPISQRPAPVVSDEPVKLGTPYTAGGVTYTPVDDPGYDAVGYASWYGEELNGNNTANGEAFNPAGITAAHPTLPMPSYVEVTALETGRTILVRVNDRGPFSASRIIDLSRGAAEQLGIAGQGSASVRVRRVNPPEQERLALRSGQAAAERMEAPESLLVALRKKMDESVVKPRSDIGVAPVPASVVSKEKSEGTAAPASAPALSYAPKSMETDGRVSGGAAKPAAPARKADAPAKKPVEPAAKGRGRYAVQVGAFSSKDRADQAAKRLGGFVSKSGSVWRVRTGPYADRGAAHAGVERAAASGFNGAQIVVND